MGDKNSCVVGARMGMGGGEVRWMGNGRDIHGKEKALPRGVVR